METSNLRLSHTLPYVSLLLVYFYLYPFPVIKLRLLSLSSESLEPIIEPNGDLGTPQTRS